MLLTTVSLSLGFFWCGVYHAAWCAPAEACFGENVPFSARVLSYPEEIDYGVSVTARVQPENGRSFRARLYLNEGYEELTLGDEITATANFSTAEVIHDREVSYYTAKGIWALGKKVHLEQLTHPEHLPWTLYPPKLAHWMQDKLDALYSGDSGGLLKALTTGEKDGMSDAFRSALSRTGLSHITAVSGMHMVFLVELFLAAAREPAVEDSRCDSDDVRFRTAHGYGPLGGPGGGDGDPFAVGAHDQEAVRPADLPVGSSVSASAPKSMGGGQRGIAALLCIRDRDSSAVAQIAAQVGGTARGEPQKSLAAPAAVEDTAGNCVDSVRHGVYDTTDRSIL